MRLINRVPGRTGWTLLVILPFAIILFAYLASSAQRLEANPNDKLLPSFTQMSSAVDRLAFTPDKRSGDYLFVAEGEFCTLVGASGCGKSTFLRMLLGQERPSRGVVLLDDRPIANEPDASRGVVFQRYSVFPHLSVLDNVALGLELPKAPLLGRLFGQGKREAREQAEVALRKVCLGHSLDKHLAQLSGGMQQRLAIAQALLMKPRVLLLDEPFGALDPGIRKDMHELLLDLWQETRLTVFMVAHDLSEGFTLGTRNLVFDNIRLDPHAPGAYAARVTYDVPLNADRRVARAAIGDLPAQLGQTHIAN